MDRHTTSQAPHGPQAAIALRQESESDEPRGTASPSSSLLINKTQLASLLGISVRHVDKLRMDGLPSVQLGARVLFRPASVDAWLRDREAAEVG